jgi:hypothetical protein
MSSRSESHERREELAGFAEVHPNGAKFGVTVLRITTNVYKISVGKRRLSA